MQDEVRGRENQNFEMMKMMDIMWPISQSHVYQSCLCSLK